MGAIFDILAWAFQLVSWQRVQWVGRGLGRLGWGWTHRERRRARRHLAQAWPDRDDAWTERVARDCFEHLGALLTECLWLSRRDCEAVRSVVRVEGWHEVERARESGRAILILTGHCGNWELLGAVVSCWGLPLTVPGRQMDDPLVNRRLLALRAHFGTDTIERGTPGAARKLLRTLREGGALGMLIDQDTQVEGVWVPFFGRLAYTPIGAAEIALRQDAIVIPAFIEREPDGVHRAVFHPPLTLPADPVEATALMTRCIEEQVRRVPEQWVWMHRRWRRRPEQDEGETGRGAETSTRKTRVGRA